MSSARAHGDGLPFGRYVLQERIARGGMGEVFRAVAIGASGFEKPVVVKRLLPQLTGQRIVAEMFVTEAKVMSRLAHPNIVQVIDFGQGEQEDYFLVLELVDGLDLGQFRQAYERAGELVPVPLSLYVTAQMLRGLSHAHERAYDDGRVIVHRDVSPSNVLLSAVGEVKVADFGVVHVAAKDDQGPGQRPVVGKPGYMAPEQIAGEAVDVRADVYAAGAVLFELLTHRLPADARRRGTGGGAPPPADLVPASALRPDLTAELDGLLAEALAARPERRFGSARAMMRAIDQLQSAGHPVASADDLAEAVERARAGQRRAGAPVLVLGGGDAPQSTPLRELTRVGPDEPFTLRLSSLPPAGSATPALPQEAERRPPQPPSQPASHLEGARHGTESSAPERLTAGRPLHRDRAAVARPAVAAAAIIAVAGALVAWLLGGVDDGAPPPRLDDGPPAGAATDDGTAPSSPRGEQRSPASPASSASAQPGTAMAGPHPDEEPGARPPPRGGDGGASRAGTTPAPSGSGPPPAPGGDSNDPGCVGELHLYANHGWEVRGGPEVVQAPGRYRWPCGSYGLRAISRMDPGETRRQSVVVRADRTSVVDLRP